MLQTHLKVVLHCTKPLPFIYFHGKNVSDQSSVKVLKPIEFLFLNKRWRCNKMLLFYVSLPLYLKNSNFLYWMVQYHTQIHPDKILGCKKLIFFDIIEKNVILCVLEMSALGTTLMTVSI